MSEKLKIGFLFPGDPTDTKYFSGTVARLHDIISKSGRIEIEDIVVPPHRLTHMINKITRISSLRKNNVSFLTNILDSSDANRKINGTSCNIIFSPAASPLMYSGRKALRKKKLIYLSDATYHKMIGYYYNHSKHDEHIRDAWEQAALELASAIIYPANWPVDDAVNHYHTDPEKIHLIKYGANMDDTSAKIVKSGQTKYKLLLVGVDYERKGVDVAIETVKLLNDTSPSIKFELSVVGLNKPDKEIPEYVTFYGRLNKNNKEEYKKLVDCYLSHDIFILPTRAECTGISFAEASLFGLPCFTYNTGGTAEYVEDGVSGRCLDPSGGAKEFCDAILGAINSGDIERYSLGARKKYENELNWDKWLNQFEDVVFSLA